MTVAGAQPQEPATIIVTTHRNAESVSELPSASGSDPDIEMHTVKPQS